MTFSLNPEQYQLLKQQDLEQEDLFLLNILSQLEEEMWKVYSDMKDIQAIRIQKLWRLGWLKIDNTESIFEFQITDKTIKLLEEINKF